MPSILKRFLLTALAIVLMSSCGNRGGHRGDGSASDSIVTVTSLTVYLERSGSMVPYDTPGGRGELKRAVNDIVNAMSNADSTHIAIVNDSVYPYNGTLQQFLQDRDIYGSTAGVGNAAYTDFQLILTQMLRSLHVGQVAVLVSDLIYSPQGMDGVSTDKLFNEERSVVHNVFNNHRDKGVIIHKMRGDYHGAYYPAMGGSVAYNGDRPFYLVVVADTTTMRAIEEDDALCGALMHPTGVVDSYRFDSDSHVPARILPRHESNKGRWRIARGERLALTDCHADPSTGNISFTVAVDMSGTQRDSTHVTDLANYHVSSLNGFTLDVKPVANDMITGNNKRYLAGMTHLLTLTGRYNGGGDKITITMDNGLPEWVITSNTEDDRDPSGKNFASSTMGLLSLMQGIYDACHTSDEPLLSLEINIK